MRDCIYGCVGQLGHSGDGGGSRSQVRVGQVVGASAFSVRAQHAAKVFWSLAYYRCIASRAAAYILLALTQDVEHPPSKITLELNCQLCVVSGACRTITRLAAATVQGVCCSGRAVSQGLQYAGGYGDITAVPVMLGCTVAGCH